MRYKASMALEDHLRTFEGPASWVGRLKRARLVLIAASVVFFARGAAGVLPAMQAAIAFVIVAGASLIDFDSSEEHALPALSLESQPLAADWLAQGGGPGTRAA